MNVPPQNIEAEESVLGAMLVAEPTLTRVIDEVKLNAGDFYLEKHAAIFTCIHDLYAASKPVDELSVSEALTQRNQIEAAGGKHYVSELAAKVPAAGNAKHYAEIVQGHALERAKRAVGQELQNGLEPAEAIERLRRLVIRGDASVSDRWSDGGAFILDTPDKPVAIWGRDDEVAWASSEALMLAAPPGLGKTTLAQQLALALTGIGPSDLLGFAVRPVEGKVGYIAADRPAQAARSFARMVSAGDREALDERLLIWRGPLPFDLAAEPSRLVPFLKARNLNTVVIDSLGAVAFDLASDEAGSRVFAALGEATAEGIDVVVLHHDRKREQNASKVRVLDDVYGSRWLTAALGSVLYLDGKAGDLVVTLRHLKQPAMEIGPLAIRHDHEAGHTVVHEPADLIEIAARGVTVKEAAAVLFETSDPSPNEIEKARRRLDKLADRGDLGRGPAEPGEPTVYRRPE